MQGRTLPKLHCEEKHGVPYNATFVERCPHLLCWTLGMQTSELYLAPTEHFLYAKHCSEGLQHLSYLILVTARSSRCSYYPHFADGKADTAKTKNLTKTTQLVSDRAGPRSQGVGLQNHLLITWHDQPNPFAFPKNLFSILFKCIPLIQVPMLKF